jgi:hypothetical protein
MEQNQQHGQNSYKVQRNILSLNAAVIYLLRSKNEDNKQWYKYFQHSSKHFIRCIIQED